MTSASQTTTTADFELPAWAETTAQLLGRDLGRLVKLLLLIVGAALWVVVQLFRIAKVLIHFGYSVSVYLGETKGGKRQMRRKTYNRHTTRRRVNAKTYRPATATKGARK